MNEDVFASCSFDTTIKIWNWKKSECLLQTLIGHTLSVLSICLLDD